MSCHVIPCHTIQNAIPCLYHVVLTLSWNRADALPQLLPDGPELIERFIAAEGDTSARRSAFLFLYNEAEELAIDFLNDHMDDVSPPPSPVSYVCLCVCVFLTYLLALFSVLVLLFG